MSSLMGSHGVALATAMAAVSGTVILIAVCRQKPLSAANGSPIEARCNLRSCISSDERKRERGSRKKKKRVHFAKDVVVEFDKESSGEEENLDLDLAPIFVPARGGVAGGRQQMPANRAALYHGILQDRLQRMASSF